MQLWTFFTDKCTISTKKNVKLPELERICTWIMGYSMSFISSKIILWVARPIFIDRRPPTLALETICAQLAEPGWPVAIDLVAEKKLACPFFNSGWPSFIEIYGSISHVKSASAVVRDSTSHVMTSVIYSEIKFVTMLWHFNNKGWENLQIQKWMLHSGVTYSGQLCTMLQYYCYKLS